MYMYVHVCVYVYIYVGNLSTLRSIFHFSWSPSVSPVPNAFETVAFVNFYNIKRFINKTLPCVRTQTKASKWKKKKRNKR